MRSTFAGLERVFINTGWLLVGLFALWLFAAPGGVVGGAVTVGRTYLVVAVGLLLIRSTSLAVDALDGLSRRHVEGGPWQRHYDHLRRLVPTFRACLEYALWIGVAALAATQLGRAEAVSRWAPPLIEAIGLFFLGRVLIELGHLEISRRMLPEQGLDEMTRRRRSTIAPIVRSAFAYGVYFGIAVLILASLGFNPLPFLAGAGILGLVVGFGAQTLIHDVVSGRETPDVLGDTEVDGISAFGPLMLTVRTSTRVRPGRHEAAAARLRLAMKEAFDRRATGAPRKSLVPEKTLTGTRG